MSNTPLNPAPASPAANRNGARARPRPVTNGSLLWWLTVGALGLMFVADLPNEIVRWKHAAAIVARDSGAKEKGYELLSAAYANDRDHPKYWDQELRWRVDDENYERVVELLDRRIEARGPQLELLFRRSQALLHLSRYEEAIADCVEINRISEASGEPTRAEALNGLAYARGVARLDLEAAEREIDAAIVAARGDVERARKRIAGAPLGRLLPSTDDWIDLGQAEAVLAMTLDSRGFILGQRNRLAEALADMNDAIERFKRLRSTPLETTPKSARAFRSFAAYDRRKRDDDRNIAILYYHRHLIHKKLGDKEAANRDFERARDLLGKEPDESLF